MNMHGTLLLATMLDLDKVTSEPLSGLNHLPTPMLLCSHNGSNYTSLLEYHLSYTIYDLSAGGGSIVSRWLCIGFYFQPI